MNSWRKFMMLAKCILVNPSGRHFPGETFKNYKDRVKRWFEGDFTGLWAEVIAEESKASHKLKKSNSSFNSLRSNNAHCACRAVQDGLFSKAIQALSSNGLAKATLEVRDELLMKHPQAPPPQLPVGTPPNTAQISDTIVLNCLKSFLPGSAPGPTNLRANHLKEAILCPTPSRASSALQSISKIVNLLCSGQAPPDLMPHLCGATLLASQKKDGGHHPIAVGKFYAGCSPSASLEQYTMKLIISLHLFKLVSASQLGLRLSYTLSAASKMITTFPPLINGPSSKTSQKLSTPLLAARCLRKQDLVSLVY